MNSSSRWAAPFVIYVLTRLRSRPAVTLASCVVAGSAGVWGCSGEEKVSAVADSKLPQGVRAESVEHEACNESGNKVEILDANGDGKPDIRRVYSKSTGKEICRITDLNHDGKADLYEYFDANGDIRRREADYDDNGIVDAIEYYEHGKLVRREYDTTGQHRIDTWDFFDPATGKRVRRERDTTNDGRVDQWWTWDGDKVTIDLDKEGNGKPDPAARIILGGAGDGGLPSVAASGTGGAGAAGGYAPPSLDKPDAQLESPDNASLGIDGGAADSGPTRKEKR